MPTGVYARTEEWEAKYHKMIRLTKENIGNSGADYSQIFKERAKKGLHWQDNRRWKILLKYFKSGKLIDLGCLDSEISKILRNKRKSFNYLGIDSANQAILSMREKYNAPLGKRYETGVEFIECNLEHLTEFDNSFDYAILGEVLEHLEEPQKAIKEAFRVLRPGGVLAISVPLEEAKEPGAVDIRHLWSFNKQDLVFLVNRYSNKLKFKVLRSKWFPKYQYCWPQLLCWAWKK